MSVEAVASHIEHSSVSLTLDRYGHLMEGLDAEVAERLDALQETAWRRPERSNGGMVGSTAGKAPRPDQEV